MLGKIRRARRAGCNMRHALRTAMPAEITLSFLEFIACGCGLVFSFRHDTNFFFFVIDERMRWNAFVRKTFAPIVELAPITVSPPMIVVPA